ncbi:MAG: PQQ-dependent sugar dehydrogenase [Deferrisomatales bacterium]
MRRFSWRGSRQSSGSAVILAGVLLAAAVEAVAAADVYRSELHAFRVEVVVRGLEHPWGMAFLPDGRLLVTERPGRLRIVVDGALDPRPLEGLPPVAAHGQGGLLDVALHPDFGRNRLVYLSYAGAERGTLGRQLLGTEVARGRLEGHRLADVEVIFRAEPKTPGGRHFGSRLVFDRQGYLFVTLGDRGEMDRAQRLDDHAGSIVRLHDDGRVPEDNPFVSRPDARPEIYTYGNRNVQGAVLHPDTGVLWTHEHGPQGGDEINVVRAGTNYGWPVITYGVNYVTGTRIGIGTEKEGMAQPLLHWTPSIAPSGMAFYDGERFPRWRGHLFVGALRGQHVVRVEVEGEERVVRQERLLEGVLGRVRDVRSGPDGYLYLLTDHPAGVLARLVPAEG